MYFILLKKNGAQLPATRNDAAAGQVSMATSMHFTASS